MSGSGLITSFFSKVPKKENLTIEKSIHSTKPINQEKSSLAISIGRLLKQELTPSQVVAFDLVRKGNSIFITGSAGTGKSFLINTIKTWAEKNDKKIAITALTGAAAALIQGKTIHSWASVGTGKDTVDDYYHYISNKWPAKMKWFKTNILVIDEVSMMDARFLDMLEDLACRIRRSNKPFGGIQVILCGDFFQLPPVSKSLRMGEDGEEYEDTFFCFEANCWNKLISHTVELKEIMRQKDIEFATCLQKVRKGLVDEEVINLIESCYSKSKIKKEIMTLIKPTRLYTTRVKVDEINTKELIKLQKMGNEVNHYNASGSSTKKSTPEELERYLEIMDKDNPYEKDLYLAKDAQVMLLANLFTEEGLVNGSRGVIIDFQDNYPIVKFMNGIELQIKEHEWRMDVNSSQTIIRKQIPLKLAWAITVHKSQGASLDCVELDIGSSIFEYGQTYVALSRVRSIDGLNIKDFNPKKIMAHPRVIEFYDSIH